jgi:hypothetical protein
MIIMIWLFSDSQTDRFDIFYLLFSFPHLFILENFVFLSVPSCQSKLIPFYGAFFFTKQHPFAHTSYSSWFEVQYLPTLSVLLSFIHATLHYYDYYSSSEIFSREKQQTHLPLLSAKYSRLRRPVQLGTWFVSKNNTLSTSICVKKKFNDSLIWTIELYVWLDSLVESTPLFPPFCCTWFRQELLYYPSFW